MEPVRVVQIVQIFVLILLLFCSAFFSMSETALMSISKIDARHMVSQNIKGAELVSKLVEDPSKLLGAILVGNNLVNVASASLSTVVATNLFGSAGVGIATGAVTILVLIFGEITPKSLSTQNPQRVAILVARPISIVVASFSGIVKVLMIISNVFIKLLGGNSNTVKDFMTAEQLKTIVTVSHEEGVLEDEEKEMIYNVFDFGDLYAKDIMIPRTDMIAIDIEATYNEVIALYKEYQFSRMPVFEETHDNIVGMIYMKDFLIKSIKAESFKVKDIAREAYFVHEYKQLDELFKELRSKKLGLALVVDEYGGTSGLITLEDLIEEIVGEIDDEYDISEENFSKISDTEFLVDGTYRISDVNEELGLPIQSNEFDSIGGFIIGLLDRFPNDGEVVEWDLATFIVEETCNNRINKVRIKLKSKDTNNELLPEVT
ncbi:hemolysin [Candidatus Epulonipiscium fishelsonii]|uniref:Hemolysin n=1 Tax=Candidatus Epulonipiscium fishelsonii TaxID=77094 RepID=A0ACC8XA83_9FIRM|nr:hemolysin [Epulopiscium sp. SCG-D08WGA-EpuloA1]